MIKAAYVKCIVCDKVISFFGRPSKPSIVIADYMCCDYIYKSRGDGKVLATQGRTDDSRNGRWHLFILKMGGLDVDRLLKDYQRPRQDDIVLDIITEPKEM